MLSMDHCVRSIAVDFQRASQQLSVTALEAGRLADEREEAERTVAEGETALVEIAGAKTAIEAEIRDHMRQNEELRGEAENLQRDLAGLQSELAVVAEGRSAVPRDLTARRDQEISLDSRAKD